MEIGQPPMMLSQENRKLNQSQNLKINVSLNELTVILKSVSENTTIFSKNLKFPENSSTDVLLDKLKLCLEKLELRNVLRVKLVVNNDLSVLVPNNIYDNDLKLNYLKFNSEVLENDTAEVDELIEIDAKNVYIPYANINNFLIDKFGSFEFYHYSTILIQNIFNKIECSDCIHYNANAQHNFLNIIIFKGKSLIYSNSFNYKTKEDLLYYILFVSKQLNVVNSETEIMFVSNNKEASEEFNYLKKFVKNTIHVEESIDI